MFPIVGKFTCADKNGSRVTVKTTHSFTKSGTYFTILRVISQREGNAKMPYTRIQNMIRVQVVGSYKQV